MWILPPPPGPGCVHQGLRQRTWWRSAPQSPDQQHRPSPARTWFQACRWDWHLGDLRHERLVWCAVGWLRGDVAPRIPPCVASWVCCECEWACVVCGDRYRIIIVCAGGMGLGRCGVWMGWGGMGVSGLSMPLPTQHGTQTQYMQHAIVASASSLCRCRGDRSSRRHRDRCCRLSVVCTVPYDCAPTRHHYHHLRW